MAKYTDKKATTHATDRREQWGGSTPPKQDWKRDRYEQRAAKATARRNITGGF
jgi:hypothetical protein